MIDNVGKPRGSAANSRRDGRSSTRPATRWKAALLASGIGLLAPRAVWADGGAASVRTAEEMQTGKDDDANASALARSKESEPLVAEPPHTGEGAARAARQGGFLPLSLVPATDFTSGVVLAGYDGARKDVVYQGAADAHVVAGLAVRAGYASHDLSGRASALLGGRFQFVRQNEHGVDLGAGLFYLPQDIRGEGQIMGSVSLGRRLGEFDLFANIAYGQDPEGDDHTGQVGMAALYRWAPSLLVGIDGRARTLVFSSDAKRTGLVEPTLDLQVGPVAHYVLGVFALTAHVGLSGIAFKGPVGSAQATTDFRSGVSSLLGVGLAL